MAEIKKFLISEWWGIALLLFGVILAFGGVIVAIVGVLYATKYLFVIPLVGLVMIITGLWILIKNAVPEQRLYQNK